MLKPLQVSDSVIWDSFMGNCVQIAVTNSRQTYFSVWVINMRNSPQMLKMLFLQMDQTCSQRFKCISLGVNGIFFTVTGCALCCFVYVFLLSCVFISILGWAINAVAWSILCACPSTNKTLWSLVMVYSTFTNCISDLLQNLSEHIIQRKTFRTFSFRMTHI